VNGFVAPFWEAGQGPERPGRPGGKRNAGRSTVGRGGEPRHVANSLAEAAELMGAPGAVQLAALAARWEEVVGPQLASHTSPVWLRDGVLSVSVDHPTWAAEVRLLSAGVVNRAREVVGDVVSAVSVRVSRWEWREW
jgi:predicted nucleic acid-binding Zn ribbon protein